MNALVKRWTRYLAILGLMALLLQTTSSCFLVCGALGLGSDCFGDEEDSGSTDFSVPPPDPSIGVLTVAPGFVEGVLGSTVSAVVELTDKPSADVVPQFTIETAPEGVTATLDTSIASADQPDIALLNVVVDSAPANYEPLDIKVAASASGFSTSRASFRVEPRELALEDTVAAVAVSAGSRSSLALLEDGTVRAWGNNFQDQLGLGDLAPVMVTRPMPVVGLAGVTHIDAGVETSMARTANGEVWVWGSNFYGQLADDALIFGVEEPVPVPQVSPAVNIHGGPFANFAFQDSGETFGWGWSTFLASPDIPRGQKHHDPVVMPDLAGIQAISVGLTHGLALRPDGTVLAWGENQSGALGDGTTVERWQIDVVPGLTNVQTVATGYHFSLALRSDGTVWAWGANNEGQLGTGNRVDQLTPVQISGLTDVVAIDTYRDHSLALKSDGTVWTWGSDQLEVLGVNVTQVLPSTLLSQNSPRQIAGLSNITSISAGSNHSLAIDGCGRVWAWGVNNVGQLGNGSKNYGPVPAPVPEIGMLNPCDYVVLWQEKAGTGSGNVRKATGSPAPSSNSVATNTNINLNINSTDLNCGPVCSETFTSGETVTLIAEPDPGSQFDLWAGDCNGTQPQVTLTITDNLTCIAVFYAPPMNLLTVNVDGPGRVTGSPAGIDCGSDCTQQVVRGDSIHLTAEPGELARFRGWSGHPDCVGGSDPAVVELTVLQPVSCTAEFVSLTELAVPTGSQGVVAAPYTLEVLRGGPVVGTVTGDGFDCGQDCSEEYVPGASTQITLLAEDDPSSGARFGNWLGCDQVAGNQCTVNVVGSTNVTAFFLRDVGSPVVGTIASSTFHLNVSSAGGGGGTITGTGIDCGQDCSESYDSGTQVALDPQPDTRSEFAGWSGDADCSDGLLTLDADLSCTGAFELKSFNLSVNVSGTGTVTSAPGGVNCGTDCAENYDIDSVVTLNAIEGPGTRFVGWSGTDFDLAITRLEAAPQPVKVGDPLTYEIDVTNLGAAAASGVTLTTFTSGTPPTGQISGPPPDATLVSFEATQGSCSQPSGPASPVGCVLEDLPANATATVTLVLTPDSPTLPSALGAAPLMNGASVSIQGVLAGNGPDVDPSNNTMLAATHVLPASGVDLAVSVIKDGTTLASIGKNLTFHLEVVNHGPDSAGNVNLRASTGGISAMSSGILTGPGATAELLSFLTSQGSCSGLSGPTATIECTLGSLAAGEGATVEVTIKPASPTLPLALGLPPLSYNALVFTRDILGNMGNDLDVSNNEMSAATHVLPASGADLTVSRIEVGPELVPVGSNLTYSFEVTNNGPDLAQGVLFTTLTNSVSFLPGAPVSGPPTGLTFVSASTSQGSCPQPAGPLAPLQCSLGTLAPGARVNISVIATADSPTLPLALGLLPLTNSAGVFTQSALSGSDADPDPSNNVASVSSRVLPGDCSGSAMSIQVTINGDKTCRATFNQVHTLSVAVLVQNQETFSGIVR